MRSRCEEYRRRAAECEQFAEGVKDALLQSICRKLAQQWRHLARHVEILDKIVTNRANNAADLY